MRDGRDADYYSRAADSAACLLVVGGYQENADILCRVVEGIERRFLLSPSLGDFFEVRFADLGDRPAPDSRRAAEVVKLAVELTSRPDDAARNFSALVLVDQSAAAIDRVLKGCAGDPVLRQLNTRYYGMASKEDRPGHTPGGKMTERGKKPKQGNRISIAPRGRRTVEELVTGIYDFAEELLQEFGSGWKPGVPAEDVSKLGAVIKPAARGVIAQVTAYEEALYAERRDYHRADEPLVAETEEADRNRREAELREVEAEREQAVRRAEAANRELTEQLEDRRRVLAQLEAEIAQIRQAAQLSTDRDARRDVGPVIDEPASYEVVNDGPAGELSPARRDAAAPERADVGGATDRSDGSGQTGGRLRGLASRVRGQLPQRVPEPGLAADGAVAALGECVERLRDGDVSGARQRVAALRRYADSAPTPEDRWRYRVVMLEDRLLSPRLPLGELAVDFYDVLLRLVYGQPLGYRQYRDLEYCLERAGDGALPPREPLAQAICRAEPGDPFVLAIARHCLGRDRQDKTVWPRSGDAARLLAALQRESPARPHVNLLYEAALRYLAEVRTPAERRGTAEMLRVHGYLAAALRRDCPDSPPDQVSTLTAFLRCAYPGRLDRAAIEVVFAAAAPTRALLQAVLGMLDRPGDAQWAIRSFVRYYRGKEIDEAQAAALERDLARLWS